MNDTVELLDNEVIEDLQLDGLRIIQQKNGYRFTTDAVLLANSVQGAKGKTVVELGSGSAVISILVAHKQQPRLIHAVELQPDLAQMSARSVELCKLQDIISIINANIQGIHNTIGNNIDIVICNPPYRAIGSGLMQENDSLAICRHEVAITLEQVIDNASKLLHDKGVFYLVHQTQRLAEIIMLCSKYNMAVKQLTPIIAREGEESKTILIRAVKGGREGLVMNSPIVVFDQQGNYTQTINRLYSIE
ncbi:MAG: methyltransferase [Clostridia bacterium]|nr:methyltransferase [Clostridia bacterium]